MLQKAAKMRLFSFKTSQLRIYSASVPNLLRSGFFAPLSELVDVSCSRKAADVAQLVNVYKFKFN